jgi:TolA-binding protein
MKRRTVWLLALWVWTGAGAGSATAAVSEADRLWTIGVRAFEDGLYEVAARELGRFAQVAPTDPRRGDGAVLRGKAAFALGRHADALAEFRAAAALPLRAFAAGEPTFWEAEVLFRTKQFGEARERYAVFLREVPGSDYADDALYARGFSELELGLADEALATFGTLLRQYPASELAESAAYAAARELVRAKRWDDALAILGPYAARFPRSPFLTEARYLLGVALMETGRAAEAVKALDEFVAAAPGHELTPSARGLLAEAHTRAGRAREAINEYRALLRAAPTHALAPQALYQIGELSEGLGRSTEAEAAWRTLRRDHPQDPLASLAGLGLANLYVKRRELERAMEMARQVADARGRERIEALMLLGETALKTKKLPDAESAYTAVLAEAPEGAAERFRALAGLALIAESRSDLEGAKQAYRQVAEQAGDVELARWARERLTGIEEREKPPESPAPVTAAPETPVPETAAPVTAVPESPAPVTAAPAAPETAAPVTAPPDSPPPAGPAPATPAPESAGPESPAPERPAAPAPQTRLHSGPRVGGGW